MTTTTTTKTKPTTQALVTAMKLDEAIAATDGAEREWLKKMRSAERAVHPTISARVYRDTVLPMLREGHAPSWLMSFALARVQAWRRRANEAPAPDEEDGTELGRLQRERASLAADAEARVDGAAEKLRDLRARIDELKHEAEEAQLAAEERARREADAEREKRERGDIEALQRHQDAEVECAAMVDSELIPALIAFADASGRYREHLEDLHGTASELRSRGVDGAPSPGDYILLRQAAMMSLLRAELFGRGGMRTGNVGAGIEGFRTAPHDPMHRSEIATAYARARERSVRSTKTTTKTAAGTKGKQVR